MKILLTSTSFQDTPGKHQDLLKSTGFEIDTLQGPLSAYRLIPVIAQYDGIICGDDEISAEVIHAGIQGKLKVISKYGVGLDKIDLKAAEKYKIPVTNCLGVNHITVAEHVFALLLTFYKNVHYEYRVTKSGRWTRLIGHEIFGKKFGIVGLGRIGKEIAIRAKAFGLDVFAIDQIIDIEFVEKYNIKVLQSIEEILQSVDIVTLNMNLTEENRGIISTDLIKKNVKNGLILINTARGELVDLKAIIYGLEKGILGGYLADVLDKEPIPEDYPLLKFNNVLITPHIGSRTYESVERQGLMAVTNLMKILKNLS